MISLDALGVKADDEVIATSMTFCSTVHVIEKLGAYPMMADLEEETLNIDSRLVEEAMSPCRKCILPVNFYGHPCNLKKLRVLAEAKKLFFLEDAIHAIPAKYRGRMIGFKGSTVAFSLNGLFHTVKGDLQPRGYRYGMCLHAEKACGEVINLFTEHSLYSRTLKILYKIIENGMGE